MAKGLYDYAVDYLGGLLGSVNRPTVADIYSGADTVKKRVKSLIGNPREFMGNLNEDAKTALDQRAAMFYEDYGREAPGGLLGKSDPAFVKQQAQLGRQQLMDAAMGGMTVLKGVGKTQTGLLGKSSSEKITAQQTNKAAPMNDNEFSSGPKVTLYRAAEDDYVSRGFSFSEDMDAAKAYMNNPGFGGRNLYEVSVPSGKVLDLTEAQDPWSRLSKIVGFDVSPDMAQGHIARVVPTMDNVVDALSAAGYDWVRLYDDFPSGSVTWQILSPRADWAATDAMSGLK